MILESLLELQTQDTLVCHWNDHFSVHRERSVRDRVAQEGWGGSVYDTTWDVRLTP